MGIACAKIPNLLKCQGWYLIGGAGGKGADLKADNIFKMHLSGSATCGT